MSAPDVHQEMQDATAVRLQDIPPNVLAIPKSIAQLRFPGLPESLNWHDLNLTARVYNRVTRMASKPHGLANFTVGDLVRTYGFGRKSLLNLIAAMQSARGLATPETPQEVDDAPTVSAEDIPPDLRLPLLPKGLQWHDLSLTVRVENRVIPLADNPHDLAQLTAGDLMRIAGFGRKSLLDLLTAMRAALQTTSEHAQVSSPQLVPMPAQPDTRPASQPSNAAAPSTKALSWDMIRIAKRILDLPSAKSLRNDDPRFGALIRSLDRQAQNAEDVARHFLTPPMDLAADPVILRKLNTLQEALIVAPAIEAELADFLCVEPNARNRRLVARYLGWDGKGTATLEAVGAQFHLTRERVRQIAARTLKRITAPRPFAPALDCVLQFLERNTPATTLELESKIHKAGLSKDPFRIEGLLRAAEILNRRLPFRIEAAGETRVVIAAKSGALAKRILRFARKQVRLWGATTLTEVSAGDGDERIAAAILKTQKDFQWLDEPSGWFWLSSVPCNRILARMRKVLAVANQVTLAELRRAISRDPRLQGFSPPTGVLAALFNQQAWCRVDGITVMSTTALESQNILSTAELKIIEILRRNGSVMHVSTLEDLCASIGVGKPTFWGRLVQSPVIARYAPGVYGIVGASIPPGVVEALAVRRRASRGLVDYGWLANGDLWLGYKISDGMIRNGTFSVASGTTRFLAGDYPLATQDGSRVGTLKVANNSGWGLGPFYTRRGGEPGDCLVIQVNLSAHTAVVRLGGEELLDQYQGPLQADPLCPMASGQWSVSSGQ